jgi:hypothetical protein
MTVIWFECANMLYEDVIFTHAAQVSGLFSGSQVTWKAASGTAAQVSDLLSGRQATWKVVS